MRERHLVGTIEEHVVPGPIWDTREWRIDAGIYGRFAHRADRTVVVWCFGGKWLFVKKAIEAEIMRSLNHSISPLMYGIRGSELELDSYGNIWLVELLT